VSFRDAGGLTWSNSTPGVTCRVEWASSPDGPWTNTWAGLNAIATGTNPLVTVRVPFYYRVACPPIHRTVDAPAAGRLVRSNIGNPRFVVIDVRTAAEFAPAHIRGATNIDYYAVDFAQQVGRLDREKGYLLYCRSGARSSGAFNLMKGMGFVELYAMSVGFSVFAAVPGHTDLVE
jgi:rhodanese-related sulfurtransferase